MSQEKHDRKIDYIEFPVPDLEAAKRFYTTVFNWSFTDYGPEYASFDDGRLRGGLAKTTSVQPGGPLVVMYALDLPGIKETVIDNGGEITKEIFEFPGGKRFQFRDPSGHELAVWSDK